MRRLRALACATILGLVATAALPAHGAGVSTQKFAFASWIVPDTSNRAAWYFAAGSNDVHIGEEEFTFALVGKGTCNKVRGKGGTRIRCNGRTGTLSDRPSSFAMDELAQEASIRVRDEGVIHTARWSAGDVLDDGFYTASMGCEVGTGAGGGIFRMADARGQVFGRKLTKSAWFEFNVMMSGAFIEACQGATDLVTSLAAGDRIHMEFVRR